MRKYPEIQKEKELEIIEFFKTQKDNRGKIIALHFGVQTQQVEKILNEYLKLLTPKFN